MDETRQPGIRFDSVFVEEVRFEPRDVAAGQPVTKPVELIVSVAWRTDGKKGADRSLFWMRCDTDESLKQPYSLTLVLCASISRMPGEGNLDPFEYAETVAPVAVFPYLREAVASLTRRTRFGALNLPPINLRLAHGNEPATLDEIRKGKKKREAKKVTAKRR